MMMRRILAIVSFCLWSQGAGAAAPTCSPEQISSLTAKISPTKRVQSLDTFEKLCRCDLAQPCLVHGILLSMVGFQSEASAAFQLACKLGSAPGCLITKSNPITDIAASEKACETGEARACFRLGKAKVETMKLSEAKVFLKKSCAAKIPEACLYLSEVNAHTGEENEKSAEASPPPPMPDESPLLKSPLD